MRKVERDFAATSGTVLKRLLNLRREDSGLFSDRVLRCMIFAAQCDPDRLDALVELARNDPRDVIVAAEYDADWNKLRSFDEPFTD